jgi:outer membrane protein TolC
VIVDVRDAWREMDRLSQRVAIAQQSVDLARRRVEGTQMMLAAGQTTAREMADTQDEFLAAQNDLTSVLIDHTLARLGFWRAIGRLKIADAMPGAATAK